MKKEYLSNRILTQTKIINCQTWDERRELKMINIKLKISEKESGKKFLTLTERNNLSGKRLTSLMAWEYIGRLDDKLKSEESKTLVLEARRLQEIINKENFCIDCNSKIRDLK